MKKGEIIFENGSNFIGDCPNCERLQKGLDRYGIELRPNGTASFSSKEMDRWRAEQNEREVAELRAELAQVKQQNEELSKIIESTDFGGIF